MKLSQVFDNTIRYFSEAVGRIFGPSDDAYPATGPQPFTGSPRKRTKRSRYMD